MRQSFFICYVTGVAKLEESDTSFEASSEIF